MLNAFEMAGIVFDLPAFLRANLLTWGPAARACALVRSQLVNVRCDGEVLKIGEMAPALSPLYAPRFIGGCGGRRNVLRWNGLAVQLLREVEQHLRHFAVRCEPVRARAVIPLPETRQFEFEPQQLDAQLFGLLPALLRTPLLLFGALPLPVAFQSQGTHQGLQRFAVLRQVD